MKRVKKVRPKLVRDRMIERCAMLRKEGSKGEDLGGAAEFSTAPRSEMTEGH